MQKLPVFCFYIAVFNQSLVLQNDRPGDFRTYLIDKTKNFIFIFSFQYQNIT